MKQSKQKPKITYMYPKLFGVIDSYSLMALLGVLVAIFITIAYMKRIKKDSNYLLSLALTGIVSIISGIVFACLFQNVYNFLSNPSHYYFSFAMTFYGGFFGGVLTFILMYFLYLRKKFGPTIREILVVAPGAIALAHGFGRIGCFLAGCCYGKVTNAWYGVYFPVLGKTVIPIQLFEAIFLFLLSFVLLFLAFKRNYKFTMIIYLLSYAIWRFFIEFIRDDPRGTFFKVLSPSQSWSILLLLISFPLFFIFKNVIFKDIKNDEKN